MTEQPFEKTIHIGTGECDFTGAWKLSSLLDALQGTANEQSDRLHIWHEDLRSDNLSWVLYQTYLDVVRYPHLGETITIKTYTKGSRLLYCPRYYTIFDDSGKILANCGSLLMLVDLNTRKAVSPQSAGVIVPDAQDLEAAVKIPIKHNAVAGVSANRSHIPLYTEVDINGHVNNARYADWLCNSFGFETLNQYEIKTISIRYESEIFPNEVIDTTLTISENRERFQFSGVLKSDRAFDMVGSLRIR